MNRPKAKALRRPRMKSARVAKTTKQAAIELVRLEFDSARLRLGIEQALERVHGLNTELTHNETQRAHLIALFVPQERRS